MNIFKNLQNTILKNTYRSFSQLNSINLYQYPIIVDSVYPNIDNITINDTNDMIEFKGRNSKVPKRVFII